MKRRTFVIGGIASVVGLAGCLGESNTDPRVNETVQGKKTFDIDVDDAERLEIQVGERKGENVNESSYKRVSISVERPDGEDSTSEIFAHQSLVLEDISQGKYKICIDTHGYEHIVKIV